MDIKLYKTLDADTVMNKDLEWRYTIEMELKTPQNVTQPTISLFEEPGMDFTSVNYAYIPEFGRYYFIRSYSVGPNNVYTILLECDVIETFKTEILNAEADISRVIEEGDYLDVGVVTEARKEADIYESDKKLSDEFSIVFSTIGHDID